MRMEYVARYLNIRTETGKAGYILFFLGVNPVDGYLNAKHIFGM